MPWLTMEVSRYKRQWIDQVAPWVQLLSGIESSDGRSPRSKYTHIQLHAASYSCCFQLYGLFINVHPGSYCGWLHWQCHGGLTGVSVPAVCRGVTSWMKHLSINLLRILSHLAEMVVYPCFSNMEYERKMITKRSGKSWRIYSKLYDGME